MVCVAWLRSTLDLPLRMNPASSCLRPSFGVRDKSVRCCWRDERSSGERVCSLQYSSIGIVGLLYSVALDESPNRTAVGVSSDSASVPNLPRRARHLPHFVHFPKAPQLLSRMGNTWCLGAESNIHVEGSVRLRLSCDFPVCHKQNEDSHAHCLSTASHTQQRSFHYKAQRPCDRSSCRNSPSTSKLFSFMAGECGCEVPR